MTKQQKSYEDLEKLVTQLQEDNDRHRILLQTHQPSDLRIETTHIVEMFEQHSAIMLMIDPQTDFIINVNQAAINFYGHTQSAMLKMKIFDLNQLSPEIVKSKLQHAFNSTQNTFEFPHVIANGNVKLVKVHSSPIKINNKIMLLTIVQDITERKQNEQDTQALVEGTVGKIGQDLFDTASQKLCEWLDCECAIIGEIKQDSTVEALSMYLNNQIIKNYTYRLKNTPCENTANEGFCIYSENIQKLFPYDKDLIKLEANGYMGIALLGQNHETIGILCVISRKKLSINKNTINLMKIFGARISAEIIRLKSERDYKEIEQQLEQSSKMEAIGSLAGGIAHDFNNILFPIVGHTEMLLNDFPEETPTRNSLNAIHISSLRAKELVKQILTFSRQGQNKLELISIVPIINEALKFIRSTIPSTIEIKQQIKSDCGKIEANSTQIHQVLMNLMTNAYHAMEKKGGELKISLNEIEVEANSILCPELNPGIYACLSVKDNGNGIEADVINKIFNPFFTTKAQGKGTGMGLSLVNGIITSMNGAINVSSELGKGTEFIIYLPIVSNSAKEHSVSGSITLPKGQESILLVDDERAIVNLEKILLERLGYKITTFTNSLEALAAFKTTPHKFDLIITDLTMPNMTGIALTTELHKIRPNIPVLLCTGFSEKNTTADIVSLGFKGLLLKPIVSKDLATKIRDILDEKSENNRVNSTNASQ